jgi:hypothetical protein
MAVREENPASPPRSPSARVDESFFEPTAVRDDWPEATRTTERTSARERTVQVGVELAPVGDQALRCTADAVGLSATALLRAIVLRLCREVDAGAPRLPSVLKTRMPALEGTPGATRVLRRVSLRRLDERVLRRGAATMGGTPSALIARRIAHVANHIETGPPARADDPIGTYRRLLTVLHGGGQA